jgi:AAA domain, putative AbiEii toxin, Type IV TA system
MYIKRVVLDSIKGFEKADLDFGSGENGYAGWAVVTGDNGAGKTAFLKAISLALLGPDLARTLIPDLRGWVTEGRERGTVSVEVRPNHEYDKTVRGGFPATTFWAELEFTRTGSTWELVPTDIFRRKKRGAFTGPWATSTTGWFALGYGPFRRLYGSSPDAQRLMVIPGRIPRFATLFKEDATLGEVEEWVKQLMYRKLEQREHERKTLEALLALLRDDFLRQGITILDINSDGVWLCDPANRRMTLTDMSEGYRSALAMLMDIFRHMVDVYGADNLVSETSEGVVVDKPGVVLIDEVDAHLHPAWQREIGFWLKRHFPHVQFIVTTHSPLVCQAADQGRIYHLPQPGQGLPFRLQPEEYRKVIAGNAAEILLTPAFGLEHTRSPRAVEGRRRHAQLRSKQKQIGLDRREKEELEQLELFATV